MFKILSTYICFKKIYKMQHLEGSGTYLLTPWSRVLLEKLSVNFAASQEIPRIYGTRKFLTVPTSVLRLCDTSPRNPPPPPSEWGRSNSGRVAVRPSYI
jgi:hypothetical protein